MTGVSAISAKRDAVSAFFSPITFLVFNGYFISGKCEAYKTGSEKRDYRYEAKKTTEPGQKPVGAALITSIRREIAKSTANAVSDFFQFLNSKKYFRKNVQQQRK